MPGKASRVGADPKASAPEPGADDLPPAVEAEVLQRYGDLLRVGKLRVNDGEVTWETNTSMQQQFQLFSKSLTARLAQLLPEVAERRPRLLQLAAYWICKSVSINYALVEVLLMVRRRVGVLCSIETREDRGGGLVEYGIEVLPGPKLRASLKWRKSGNLIYRDPGTASKKVKGSLSCVCTEFALPPGRDFTPVYFLDLHLRRSPMQAAARSVVCKAACARLLAGDEGREVLMASEPLEGVMLCPSGKAGAAAAAACEAAVRPAATHHSISSASTSDEDPVPLGLEVLPQRSCDATSKESIGPWFAEESAGSTARSICSLQQALDLRSTATAAGWADDRFARGQLHVGVLRARGLRASGAGAGAAGAARRRFYAACVVGGAVKRTPPVHAATGAGAGSVEWPSQAWRFSVTTQNLRDEVNVEVFALEPTGQLELLGTARAPISRALGGLAIAWEPLVNSNCENAAVELELELEMLSTAHCGIGDRCSTASPESLAAQLKARSLTAVRVHAKSAAKRPVWAWCNERTCGQVECFD